MINRYISFKKLVINFSNCFALGFTLKKTRGKQEAMEPSIAFISDFPCKLTCNILSPFDFTLLNDNCFIFVFLSVPGHALIKLHNNFACCTTPFQLTNKQIKVLNSNGLKNIKICALEKGGTNCEFN